MSSGEAPPVSSMWGSPPVSSMQDPPLSSMRDFAIKPGAVMCDQCGIARAKTAWRSDRTGGVVVTCGHHTKKHELALIADSWMRVYVEVEKVASNEGRSAFT